MQVEAILPLLKRGVGIHHGGLLPILKEVIEILFQVSRRCCPLGTAPASMCLESSYDFAERVAEATIGTLRRVEPAMGY